MKGGGGDVEYESNVSRKDLDAGVCLHGETK